MRRWQFTIEGIPKTKGRPQLGRSGAEAGGHHFTPDTTSEYEGLVGGAAMEAGLLIGAGQCDMILEVWLRPSKVSQDEPRPRSRQRKDPDNVAKVVCDGTLKAGVGALADDSFDHVRNLLVIRRGYTRRRPRVEVTVIEVLADASNLEEAPEPQPFFGAAPPELCEVLEAAARAAGWRPATGGVWVR